ncbi:RluA family pseudouridine synthase [Adhaeretor mobilis]|uniref:Ribosomal large subunit pseudouridine synthase A n=1 Tax=Adhaeretor mobilis TaxID=1930276 RepID=A0A517MXG5_9BACT|nr:RluA family pseudouridine synthase [Adhaeretor mobilis]QDS99507.1 Ribosomal large subunit pseudouridine synthase A [Adhaeretor mobilis]
MPNHSKSPEVLFEDNHLLVLNKPAGLATMGVPAGETSLLTVAKQYLALKYNKPGNVYLGVVSRLDAPVSGIVLFARTSKAASRLSEAFRTRSVEKTYLAAVEGVPDAAQGTLEHYVRKDERNQRMHTTHADAPDAKIAQLSYECLSSNSQSSPLPTSLLKVALGTGRKHQIRVQLAKIGHPILGDKKYGSESSFPEGIALHASELQLEHPVRREPLEIKANLPKYWRSDSRTRCCLAGFE